ncbi:uncharacterized protein LOC130444374 [Diorhabda sublineata]|uniref:uncharacterized protein LOC130444374 n=1 Tax=Diorhabda sublineata TaxID=1163346 RepID=UPI0024E0DA1F|nr:uncharacterized protein LOC130444374 [Diorhabda sublineata]
MSQIGFHAFLPDNILKSKAGIVANLNDYFDEILENLAQDIIFDGYDPAELPDETLSLLILGKITIDKGWLRDLSTISRYRDIELSYSSAEKKLELNFAIQFEFLQFTYDYVTELPLMTIRGEVEGKVEHVKIESALSFDFHTYHVALDYFNIMDTGKISIKFSGEGLVDWVTNAMTSVITTFLHPLILGIVQNVTKGPLQNSIDAINEAINNLINQ